MAEAVLMVAQHPDDFCPNCDQFIGVYRHGLTKAYIGALRRIYETVGTDFAEIRADVRLTNSQYSSFHKLQHWLFLEPFWDEKEQKIRRGWWRVTEKGEAFLQGRVQAYLTARTVRNVFDGYESALVYCHEVEPESFDYDYYLQTRGSG